jgi:hypothetical protein
MEPMRAAEGASYAQVYADSARLCRILAAGERAFGSPPRDARQVPLPGVPREHIPLWQRYLASTDRTERGELLAELADLMQAATGYGAAVVLSEAGLLEKELAARRPVIKPSLT